MANPDTNGRHRHEAVIGAVHIPLKYWLLVGFACLSLVFLTKLLWLPQPQEKSCAMPAARLSSSPLDISDGWWGPYYSPNGEYALHRYQSHYGARRFMVYTADHCQLLKKSDMISHMQSGGCLAGDWRPDGRLPYSCGSYISSNPWTDWLFDPDTGESSANCIETPEFY
jgi:hypothetical protein